MKRNVLVEVCTMYKKIDSVKYIYVCVYMTIDNTLRDFCWFFTCSFDMEC